MLRRRNLFKKIYSTTFLSAALVVLAGCGFQLAGSYDLSEFYPQIALETEPKYRDFNEPFEQRLQRSGVQLVDPSRDDVVQLNIKEFEMINTPVNADGRGIAESFSMKGVVRYELTFDGQVPENYVAQQGEEVQHSRERSVTATRYVAVNTEDQLSGSSEGRKKRQEIIDELSQNLMRVLVFKRDKVSTNP